MNTHNIPNIITFLRITLVPPFLWLLLQKQYSIALLIFIIAGISDALDGFLAKRYGWTSELGSILDPFADKLLLISAILALYWLKYLPLWLSILAITRDIIIIIGTIIFHLLVERVQAHPLTISKLNTLLQLLLICLIITKHTTILVIPDWVISITIYLTALTTLTSGITYMWQWSYRAHKIIKSKFENKLN